MMLNSSTVLSELIGSFPSTADVLLDHGAILDAHELRMTIGQLCADLEVAEAEVLADLVPHCGTRSRGSERRLVR